jgi:hypothetical protein
MGTFNRRQALTFAGATGAAALLGSAGPAEARGRRSCATGNHVPSIPVTVDLTGLPAPFEVWVEDGCARFITGCETICLPHYPLTGLLSTPQFVFYLPWDPLGTRMCPQTDSDGNPLIRQIITYQIVSGALAVSWSPIYGHQAQAAARTFYGTCVIKCDGVAYTIQEGTYYNCHGMMLTCLPHPPGPGGPPPAPALSPSPSK